MKTENNKKFVIVGIFILLGIAILFITIFSLGGQKKSFVKTIAITAIFTDVGGLLKGGNIWFSGVKVGTVKKINFYGTSQVLVTLNIEESIKSHIPKDARAKLGTDGLIGNKIVIIYGGNPLTASIEQNDQLKTDISFNTDELLNTLQNNNTNLLAITNRIKFISKKIDSGTGLISILLNDAALATNIQSTINNLKTATQNIKAVSIKTNSAIDNVKSFSEALTQPGSSLNQLVTDTSLYPLMSTTLLNLKNSTFQMEQFTTRLKTIGEQLGETNTPLGVILHDSDAAGSLKQTIKNVESGSKKLDEDLEALQHNFLLRGFFKKRAKAVKPILK